MSRAPYDKLAAFRERMGWTFPWYSSAGSDFNYDFHVTVDDRVAPVPHAKCERTCSGRRLTIEATIQL